MRIWGWRFDYFTASGSIFITVISLIIDRQKLSEEMKVYLTTSAIVGAVYSLLMFPKFTLHDYYVISMLLLPVLMMMAALSSIENHFNKIPKYSQMLIIALFISGFLLSIKSINDNLEKRDDSPYVSAKLFSIEPYLREIGISKNDRIIYYPDFSLQVSL